jgi:hypothetical protein
MITKQELIVHLVNDGIRENCVWPMDDNYELLEPSWITRDLSISVNAALAHAEYRLDRFDCNKFALIAAAVAALCNGRTDNKGALAFGTLSYFKLDQQGSPIAAHCINVAVHQLNKRLVTKFYEPQPDALGICLREIELTVDEQLSIFSVLFH